MKKLNLSKYYTLNLLAYFSLLSAIIFIGYKFWLNANVESMYHIGPIFNYCFICSIISIIFLSISFIEFLLRIFKKIKNYNQLELPKIIYSCLFWIAMAICLLYTISWIILLLILKVILYTD